MGWVLLFPLYYFFLKKKSNFIKGLGFAAFLWIAIVKRIRDVIFDGVEKWKYMTQLLYFAPDLEV